MSDSQKPPRDEIVELKRFHYLSDKKYSKVDGLTESEEKEYFKLRDTWEGIDKVATIFAHYDLLMQQALAMREALEFYAQKDLRDTYEFEANTMSGTRIFKTTKIDEDDGCKARQALEQFDEFMKGQK